MGSLDYLPDAITQRATLKGLEVNNDDMDTSHYEYAVSESWYNSLQKYLGYAERKSPGQTRPPGPVEMNIHEPKLNQYVKGHVWMQLIQWYGIDDYHELDRVYIGGDQENDEKAFEVCVLSPIAGKLHNKIKIFKLNEFVGYIECQMRKIFRVPEYQSSRLWICEKRKNGKFEPLFDRADELQFSYGIDDATEYMLAIEICGVNNVWPTGLPTVPKGCLKTFNHVTDGRRITDVWQQEISLALRELKDAKNRSNGFLEQAVVESSRLLMKQREATFEKAEAKLRKLIEATELKSESLEKEAETLQKKRDIMKSEALTFQGTKEVFEKEKQQFMEEKEQMATVKRIQENIVKLNIGGHILTTSTMTLTKDPNSMLAAMFSGRYTLQTDQEGCYFIDRDGTHFRYILNFLRDGIVREEVLPKESSVLAELLVEAKYYQITELINYLTKSLKPAKSFDIGYRPSEMLGTLFTDDW